jgi:hypothetical protein
MKTDKIVDAILITLVIVMFLLVCVGFMQVGKDQVANEWCISLGHDEGIWSNGFPIPFGGHLLCEDHTEYE